MKKVFKSRIFFLVLGMIIATTISVGATALYSSSEIGFTPTDPNWHVNNLEDAINDLHNTSSKTAVQVATLTTQGASYTMQNDGYITGTMTGTAPSANGVIYVDGVNYGFAVGSNTSNISVYAPKNSVVTTRNDYGTYNLTVYEWK